MDLEKETFLRVLKGAPLSVLVGLWVHGAMSRKDLKRKTGFDLKTVDDALAFLDDLKLVDRPHYRKWCIASGFYQLPLARVGLPESGEFPSSGQRPLLVVDKAESGNSPSSAAESGDSPLSALVVVDRSTTTTREASLANQTPPCPEIVAACARAGIGEPKRSLLAQLPHVVEGGPEYVAWHVAQAKREGQRLGAAIWRMEQGWPMVEEEEEETAVNGLKQQIPPELEGIIRR